MLDKEVKHTIIDNRVGDWLLPLTRISTMRNEIAKELPSDLFVEVEYRDLSTLYKVKEKANDLVVLGILKWVPDDFSTYQLINPLLSPYELHGESEQVLWNWLGRTLEAWEMYKDNREKNK